MVKDEKAFQEVAARLEKDGVVHLEDASVIIKDGQSAKTEVFLIDKAKVIQCNIRNIFEHGKKEAENSKRIHELEVFYKSSMGREERILELKKEVEQLKKELGK